MVGIYFVDRLRSTPIHTWVFPLLHFAQFSPKSAVQNSNVRSVRSRLDGECKDQEITGFDGIFPSNCCVRRRSSTFSRKVKPSIRLVPKTSECVRRFFPPLGRQTSVHCAEEHNKFPLPSLSHTASLVIQVMGGAAGHCR